MSLSCLFTWFNLSPTVLKAFNIRLSDKALDPWKTKFWLFKYGKLAFVRGRNEAEVAKPMSWGWFSYQGFSHVLAVPSLAVCCLVECSVPHCWYSIDASLELGHCFPESRTLILWSRCYSMFSVSWREHPPKTESWCSSDTLCCQVTPGAQSCPEPALSDGCSDEWCTVQALAAWKQTWRSFTNKVCFFPLELWLCVLLLTCPVLCQKLNTPFGNV